MTRPSPFDLAGRCVLVTGASSGTGQAIALALADGGANILGLSLDDGAETSAFLAERDGNNVQLIGDTSVPSDLERAAAAAIERFGRLDVWVNDAARPT